MQILFIIVIAYLLGSIPSGLLIGKTFFGVDIRTVGSRNMGSTNTFRTLGWKAGLAVQLFDIAKGIAAVAVARYVFNSPTNWVHESMFLMFGMQYLLSGAYALREGSHVRVDVLYNYLPLRGRAVMDVATSVFFFIFAGTLLWTGWIFFSDSFGVREVSFTEWGIQYWPIKLAMPIGAALILLQGLADLVRNVLMLKRGEG